MIVIDASVAVKWCVPEPGSAEAEALIDDETSRVAPEHMAVEVAQALLRHARSGRIDLDHVQASLRRIRTLVRLEPTSLFLEDALPISARSGCSVYDSLYVAAAERWDGLLVTADAKLKAKLAISAWDARVALLRMPLSDAS